jgi:hypothetical protein
MVSSRKSLIKSEVPHSAIFPRFKLFAAKICSQTAWKKMAEKEEGKVVLERERSCVCCLIILIYERERERQ